MEAAASNDEAVLMSPSGGPARKKFRARKTMTASCREQLATLKRKNSSNGENTIKGDNSLKEAPIKAVQQPDNPAPAINKSQGVFHNGLKLSIEVSQVDSGINIGCSVNETWDGISKKSEDVPLSHTTHFIVHDFNTDATENHITAVQQVTAFTNTENQAFSEEVKDEGEQTNTTCSTIPENLNASITVKIIDEDKSLKSASSFDVTPAEPPDPESSSVPEKELDASNCTADNNNAPPTSESITGAVSDSVQPEPPSDAAFQKSDLGGGCRKKRTCGESSQVPAGKRAKTSTNTLLDEVQCLIDKRVNKIFEDAFDQRMQALMRQADLVQRTRNYTDEVSKHLRSVRRLERQLKYAVHNQRQLGTHPTNVNPISSSSQELGSTVATSSAPPVLPATDAAESVPRTPPADTAKSMDLVVVSDNESEEPSNSSESRKSSSKERENAAMQKIMESIKQHRKKTPSHTDKPVKTVIDLTDDEGQKSDKDSNMVSEPCIPNGDLSAPVTSSRKSGSVENVLDINSAKKNPPSSDHNEASSSDVNEERPSATIPPNSSTAEKPAEPVAAPQTSSAPEAPTLKPPQKPHLRLAQVQNPKGIALSWNVTSVDHSCAPAKVYCLYVHQGDPNNPKKLWKKIGEIKALPLPMACTLTQFVDDTTYSFAMRAKDANGRFGPLCDIQSTTLKPQSSSKKS
ncbi:activating transcription factor 7-interacting protein 2 [Anomaloglossus baeobatrachus]|uniref:activating transcription factor 7-interacting protein 2 n=1 Tax=Anomaloglossus baeobatrachus TaxID=238106 RepID=UPI003F50C326